MENRINLLLSIFYHYLPPSIIYRQSLWASPFWVGYFYLTLLSDRPSVFRLSHAASVYYPRRRPSFLGLASTCQTLVRFFASYRIKPHAPLLVRLPVNSFEF